MFENIIGNERNKEILKKAIEINIGSLFTFVGVINIVNAILVISDGYKGVIPVFSKKDGVIKGGYIFGRCWPLSIVLFMAYQSIINDSASAQNINTPNWWPILNNVSSLNLIENMILIMNIFLYHCILFSHLC